MPRAPCRAAGPSQRALLRSRPPPDPRQAEINGAFLQPERRRCRRQHGLRRQTPRDRYRAGPAARPERRCSDRHPDRGPLRLESPYGRNPQGALALACGGDALAFRLQPDASAGDDLRDHRRRRQGGRGDRLARGRDWSGWICGGLRFAGLPLELRGRRHADGLPAVQGRRSDRVRRHLGHGHGGGHLSHDLADARQQEGHRFQLRCLQRDHHQLLGHADPSHRHGLRHQLRRRHQEGQGHHRLGARRRRARPEGPRPNRGRAGAGRQQRESGLPPPGSPQKTTGTSSSPLRRASSWPSTARASRSRSRSATCT